jgi:membrane protease YdiL (CAAX protease family)
MENIQAERQSWLKLGILMFFMLIYGYLTVSAGDGDINLNFDDPNVLILLKILQAVSVIILFILPAVLIAVLWTKPKIRYLGIATKPAFTTLLLAGVGILIAMPLINWLADLNSHMHLPESMQGIEHWMKTSEDKATELTEAFTKGTSVSTLILNLFVIAFMAALSEEIFFRGLFQKISIECFKNKHAGIWFSAIIFSAFHMQFFGFLPRMLMGAYLGYLFLWSGSLWPGIIAHFVNNGMAVFLAWLVNRGAISADVDKMGMQPEDFILVAVSAVMVAFSLIIVYRIERKRKLNKTVSIEADANN